MKEIYFLWDPIEHDFLTFATVEEQQKEAKSIIEACLDNQEWTDEVDEIVAGVITSRATQVNRVIRPESIPLDKDGVDADGFPWRAGEVYVCDCEMRPIYNEDD